MIGIKNIGNYIPENKIDNTTRLRQFGITKDFIENKLGIRRLSRKDSTESTSDLCVKSFQDLEVKETGFHRELIDCICVCTQNGDYILPQTSAVVHDKLRFSNDCAAFDISMGCSGYVYSLLVMKNFMEANELKYGILFTCDPYSLILDPGDKSTELLFGDAATATLFCENPVLEIGKGVFGTAGEFHKALVKKENEKLYMDGRVIFNFVMRHVPPNVSKCLQTNGVSIADIDIFLFHQASKYIHDNLVSRMRIAAKKVPFQIQDCGNTVSSSIPIILIKYLNEKQVREFLLTGFGVGLSVASLILRRRN
jgi:3-oxoacyl-[acyl-carrier-protein] synthase-3